MKKLLLASAVSLLSLGSAWAQTTIGLKGGLNVATVRVPGGKVDPVLGVHAGLFASAPISSKFALQPEILYSKQGVQTRDYTDHYHYLNIPLIFKGTISGGFHVQVGPQFGVLLSASRQYGKTSVDLTDDLNRYDGALALGFGYDVGAWQVSGRYNVGLSDTRDEHEKGVNYANNVFQLSLGYKIR
ncbi:porin family protein [Rufibacter soli]